MCHVMYAFQMGNIPILNLACDTIAHPLENIHTINSKRDQFSSSICIKIPHVFQNTHDNLS